MLLGQDLRRRHHRGLVPVFHRDDGGLGRHDRLARTHVSLQQPPHGMGRTEIGRYLPERPLLGLGGMKGEDLLERRPDPVVQADGVLLHLPHPPLAHHADRNLEVEKLLENHPLVRRGRAGVVPRQFPVPLLGAPETEFGKMELPDGRALLRQAQFPRQPGGDPVRDLPGEARDHLVEDLPEGARLQVPQPAVDRDDTPGMDPLPIFVQDFTLRVHDDQGAARVGVPFHLAVEHHPDPGLVDPPEVGLVEELDPHGAPFVPDQQLENRKPAAAAGDTPHAAYLPPEEDPLLRPEAHGGPEPGPVLVAEGNVVEQVADGPDPVGREDFRAPRTDPLEKLDRGIHASGFSGLGRLHRQRVPAYPLPHDGASARTGRGTSGGCIGGGASCIL